MSVPTLVDGPADALLRVILAHGAGAPMDSVLLSGVTVQLVALGVAVVRFEFPYMHQRRENGARRPPDRTDVLLEQWCTVAHQCADGRPLFVGGHSMGGRVASMVADQLGAAGVCALSYPWHPPDKPQQTRTAHLQKLRTPMLAVCGTRDPFGTPQQVSDYKLSPAVRVVWMEGADHSMRATARSGRTLRQNIADAAMHMHGFMTPLGRT